MSCTTRSNGSRASSASPSSGDVTAQRTDVVQREQRLQRGRHRGVVVDDQDGGHGHQGAVAAADRATAIIAGAAFNCAAGVRAGGGGGGADGAKPR